jgi:hypothetical protein
MPRHPPRALHSLSHTPPTPPPPPTTSSNNNVVVRAQEPGRRHTPHTPTTRTHRHESPAHKAPHDTPQRTHTARTPQSRSPRHNKQDNPTQDTRVEPSRCSRPLSRSQTTTPHHTPPQHSCAGGGQDTEAQTPAQTPQKICGPSRMRLILQNPNSVSANEPTTHPPHQKRVQGAARFVLPHL